MNNYFVTKCGHPFQEMANSQAVLIMGYVEPLLEGMKVNFSCPISRILTGPRTSMCTGNGQWDPDPNESGIKCKGDSSINCNLMTL